MPVKTVHEYHVIEVYGKEYDRTFDSSISDRFKLCRAAHRDLGHDRADYFISEVDGIRTTIEEGCL